MRRLYRMLLKLYPARFREEYAAAMERQFRDEYDDANGRAGRALHGLRALGDLAATVPAEIGREVVHDIGYAVRVYRRHSFAAILALTALSLAIGVTTGIFSVVNAVLIRSLPFTEPERLVELWLAPMNVASGRAEFQAWRDGNPYLKDAAGFTASEMNLSLTGESARVRVAETTANFLKMLGATPEVGRGFAAGEDVAGRNGVAIIGYGLWQQYFGGDARVLGSTIRINEVPLTVIGVAPLGFDYPEKTAIWTPTAYDFQRLPKAGAFGLQTIGRLKNGMSFAQGAALFDAEVRRAYAGQAPPNSPEYMNNPHLLSLRDRLAGPVASASLVLMGLVAFVLLIACANLAHLLLSRGAERRAEMAVRAALGASRARLVQQLVTEAMVLTTAATVAGMLVTYWTARLASIAQPAQLAARQYSILDWRVLLFAGGVAVLSGVLFGVLPASVIGRMEPGQDVVRQRPEWGGSSTGRLRALMTGMQAALTVALIAGSLSLGRSFLKLLGTDLAFHTDRVVTLNVSLSGTRYARDHRERQYYADALDRLRAVPGVESAASVSFLPLVRAMFIGGRFKLDSGEEGPVATLIGASPDYFRTMETALVDGREFNEKDLQGSEHVVIVSDELARGFGVGSVVGRKLDLAWEGAPRLATIVGVVRAERYAGPLGTGGAQVFQPLDQSLPRSVSFVAKVRGNPNAFLALCRDAVQGVDRAVPAYDVKTLDQRLADALGQPRFYTTAILFLTGFALLLAVAGTYGVATYSVAERTHEIGVRTAVGASPDRIRGLLFFQSMVPVVAGAAAGALASIALGRFLPHLIASAEPTGLWVSGAAVLVLSATTAAAVWGATQRIVRMDPTAALKIG